MALAFNNVAKPEVWTTPDRNTKNDFASIPFSEVTAKYRELYKASERQHEEDNQAAMDAYDISESQRIADEYNATHEDQVEAESYEGDYEALNLKPFDGKLKKAHQAQFDEFVNNFSKLHALPARASWLMPQILAKIASVPLGPKSESGKYSGRDLLNNIKKSDPSIAGAFLLTMFSKRSILISNPTSPAMRNYCSLVPLVMYAYKLYHGIPYTSWYHYNHIVEPNLFAAMTTERPNVTNARILELREEALQGKNPVTTYLFFAPAGSPLYRIPILARIMLMQIWAAHPSNRTEHMILDFDNLTNTPEPLIKSTGLFRD